MGLIATVLEQHKESRMAQMTVDETASAILKREDHLSPYVPIRYLDDFDELAYLIEQSAPIAQMLGVGQEVPLIEQGELRKLAYSLFEIALGIAYDKQKQIEMRKALQMAQARGIEFFDEVTATGGVVRGSAPAFAKMLFGNYETITKGLFDALKFLTYQCLQYGHISGYVSPLTNVSQSIDYRDQNADWGHEPQGKLAHFPPSLAGIAKAWDQPETATPLEDLQEWGEIYKDSNDGNKPDQYMWSGAITTKIMNCRSVLQKISTINMQGLRIQGVDMVTKPQLRNLLEQLELAGFIENDEQFTETHWVMEGGVQKQKKRKVRFTHDGRIIFLQKNMGEQLIGPTVEGDFVSGFNVITYEKQMRPVRDQTEGIGSVLPVFLKPQKLYSREVLNLPEYRQSRAA
ncbi:hypothetical protein [Allocoleopsis sp.]|uniref:hypothetical protein n=1 Tax=Allocoleopsis sp. TaxID=3088169 RepID=UPI002FD1BED0